MSVLCLLPQGVNVMMRVIAVKAASKPLVEITQDGETLSIKTSTSVRTTHITFTVGQEFNEATVDGRPCTVRTRARARTHRGLCSLHTQKNMQIPSIYLIWFFIPSGLIVYLYHSPGL